MKYHNPILVAALLGFVFMETNASASYLDPGVGSFALQVIAASVVAVGFFARKFWSRIVSFFIRNPTNCNTENKK